MSTSVDGRGGRGGLAPSGPPPSADDDRSPRGRAPGATADGPSGNARADPEDGVPVNPVEDSGPMWLQEQIRRRMDANAATGGNSRHARAEDSTVQFGVEELLARDRAEYPERTQQEEVYPPPAPPHPGRARRPASVEPPADPADSPVPFPPPAQQQQQQYGPRQARQQGSFRPGPDRPRPDPARPDPARPDPARPDPAGPEMSGPGVSRPRPGPGPADQQWSPPAGPTSLSATPDLPPPDRLGAVPRPLPGVDPAPGDTAARDAARDAAYDAGYDDEADRDARDHADLGDGADSAVVWSRSDPVEPTFVNTDLQRTDVNSFPPIGAEQAGPPPADGPLPAARTSSGFPVPSPVARTPAPAAALTPPDSGLVTGPASVVAQAERAPTADRAHAEAPTQAVPEQRNPVGARFPAPDDLASRRVRVVLSERKGNARTVRTVVEVQEGTAVGDLLRSNLIGTQLMVAMRYGAVAVIVLGLLPALFAVFPEIGRAEVLGIRLPWLLLGALVYPFLLGLGWLHTRAAEKVEQSFADDVQD
ncbi:MAG: hypothetical protein OJJ54_10480 [Pseudonocardia sp.]|nr:hypothetical protein [Pseudonocardia sp.]